LTLKEDLSVGLALFQEVLDGRRDGVTVEKRYVRKDGSLVHAHLSTQCVRKADGSLDYSVAVVQDISERKHAEEERSRLEEQLRQAQKIESIGRLAGGVAHDFNNLLTPIIGYAEIALMNMEEGHPARADLQEILSAASRAKELTQQLLAFSRKQLLETKVIHLNTVLIEFQKMLRRLIGEDIEIVSRLDPALGPIKADPSQIQQIIINLAVNARDAMPQGGRLVIETKNVFLDEEYAKARLGVEPGPYVMVAVSDTGHGMDADVKRHLFEPFFTTKEPGKGTGLGLATVYGIVKQHGGAVWVYSEPGRGTTFRIYLRRVEEAAPGVERALKPHEERGTETVLVVEDSEMVRKLASDILAGLGYGILVAESPGTALRVAAEHAGPIELLLTDVVMPEMNGRELYERLVSTHPDLKVLYMSGYTGDVVAYQGILDTGIQFIQKPFSVHELARKVRETLDA
jgi:signal transduction histidine kinase